MPIYKQKEKKDGLTKYKVRVNYTDSFGNNKQLTRVAYGLDSAKELERQLVLQTQNKEVVSDITIDWLFQNYYEHIKYDIRQTTYVKKNQVYRNHIKPFLENVNLKKLDVRILAKWKSYVNDKDLAFQSKKNTYKELNACLNYAVKMEYLPSNPLSKVDNFKNAYEEKKNVNFYTPNEYKQFISAALSNAEISDFYDYYIFFSIAYFTGARKGEIHALRWNCYDGKYISIKKSISQKLKTGDVETPPKNKSSIRTIRVPEPLAEILNNHKKRQQTRISDWNEEGFICGYYRCLRDSSLENENKKYSSAANLKKIRIHDFRHSHASLLINANISPLEVAHRLGHSTVEQTLRTYSHLFPNEEDRAISVLNDIFK